ncbi:hypothetical protein AB1484_19880 [Parafrankia sp. FMc6]|uniref:hypothetical protein n=1 Tax=Parafrankia soli TaxID=2599596 RepID=UPI0034D5081D
MADDELYRRWQVARLTEPLHRLEIRSATKADFNHVRYDLVQLALRAIDYVVAHQASMEGTVTPDELVAHLAGLARRLSPDDPDRPWAQVAKLTLANLLNDGRPLRARWGELADSDDERSGTRTYSFRLLRLLDAGDSPQLSATDEAVMLYLQALDVDLADREAAAKLILRRQMEAGEFERARRSAVDARRTAEGLAASLRDRLDETRRDLRGVDWNGDVPAQLRGAHQHVTEQLGLDRHILDLAERGIERGSGTERDACRAVLAEVRRSQEVHTRLERLIVGAIPVYLAAQEAQRFASATSSLAVDLGEDVLMPYLAADEERASTAATDFVGRLCARCPPVWTLDTLAAVLLRPPAIYEQSKPAWDDPGDLDEPEERGLPADVEAAASAVFRECRTAPHRLSELAVLGAHHAEDVADVCLLDDVIHLAAAGRFVAGGGFGEDDPGSASTGLAAALEGLAAEADRTPLVGGRWRGDDLLVGRASDLAVREAEGTAGGAVVASGERLP